MKKLLMILLLGMFLISLGSAFFDPLTSNSYGWNGNLSLFTFNATGLVGDRLIGGPVHNINVYLDILSSNVEEYYINFTALRPVAGGSHISRFNVFNSTEGYLWSWDGNNIGLYNATGQSIKGFSGKTRVYNIFNINKTTKNVSFWFDENSMSNINTSNPPNLSIIDDRLFGSDKNVRLSYSDYGQIEIFRDLTISGVEIDYQFFYNYTTYETKIESFYLTNFTINGTTASNIYLNYAGTNYSATSLSNGGGNYNFSSSLQVPLGAVANHLYFIYYNGSNYLTSTNKIQIVNLIQFGICNSTLSTKYLNITFQDESSLAKMNGTIPTSTFTYSLGSLTINKTFLYTNVSLNNQNYTLCFRPNTEPLNLSYNIQYSFAGYPQRTWNQIVTTYTSTLTSLILPLLSSVDGIYVTFQVINSADQLISGVSVNATRNIGGTETLVASGTTGADGTVTFWLNPDFSHILSFAKTGYTTYTTSLIPTQSSYTITLSGGVITGVDYTQGINYWVYPSLSLLYNNTAYDFMFNLTSNYWDIDSFGFQLRLSNGTIVGSDSSSTETVAASYSYDVNNQSIIYMDYYWIVEGNTTTGSKYWVIQNTDNTGWSIKNFFVDFNTYISSGIFGLDTFGRYLITFILLFLVVGIMSYKYGLTSPMAVTTMIFVVIFFLDVIVGLIPTIRGVEHLLTYAAGLILAISVIKEVMQ